MQRFKQDTMLAIVFLVGIAAVLAGCGAANVANPPPPPVSNPAPTVASLSPASAIVHGTDFTLTLNGSNFNASTVVIFNGTLLPTTLLSGQQVTTTVPASLITVAGVVSVAVENVNFSPSNSLAFRVNNPAPVISSISPGDVTAGAPPFLLVVNGSNYVDGATLMLNGKPRTATQAFSSQFFTEFSASEVAAAESFIVTVVNPDPAVSPSNPVTFNINPLTSNPLPTLTSASDGSVPAGWPGFLLTVDGTNFVAASVLRWNGVDQATTVNSTTELQAAIPASEINSAGSAQIVVANPSPGGGSSGSAAVVTQAVPPGTVGVIELSNIGNDFSAPDSESDSGAVGGDGRFVLFRSSATDLAPGRTDVTLNVYLRDTCIGAQIGCVPSVTLVPLTSEFVSLSANGRYVGISFGSSAFAYDTCFGAPVGCVPFAAPIDPTSDTAKGEISFSANGRFAAYIAGSFICDDFSCDLQGQVYLADTCADVVSGCTPSSRPISQGGVPGFNTWARDTFIHPYISPDGRFVTFNTSDHDIQFFDSCQGGPANCSPSTTLLSVASDGSSPADAQSFGGSISSGGRYVVFISLASNLVPGVPDATVSRIYLRDMCTGAPSGCVPNTTLIAVVGNQAAEDPPSMSADGRYIAFTSESTDLVPEDTNDVTDVFVRDTCIGVTSGCTGSTVRVSVALDGTQGNSLSHRPVISSDGHFVVFSTRSKLGPGKPYVFSDMIYLARH